MTSLNYSNGKIYKIECLSGEPDDIYIGSTTKELLSQRMTTHRYLYNCFKRGKKVCKVMSYDLFDKYGIENCVITLLELCPCSCKDELLSREGFYMRNLKCVNKMILGNVTKYDYSQSKKDYGKQYRLENKESIKEKKKTYRLKNKESFQCCCGGKFTINNRLQHLQTKKHQLFISQENI